MLLDSAQVLGSPQQFDRVGVKECVRAEAQDVGTLTKRLRELPDPMAADSDFWAW
jgi:hypothetical protein